MPQLPNLVGGVGFAGGPGDNGSRPAVTDRNNLIPGPVSPGHSMMTRWCMAVSASPSPGSAVRLERATVGSSRITTSLSTQPDGVTPLFNLADPFPTGLLPVVGTSQGLSTLLGQSIVGIERDQKSSYQVSWSADVQRQLSGNFVVTAGYVGNVGRNLRPGST